jgi:hypothetical protein
MHTDIYIYTHMCTYTHNTYIYTLYIHTDIYIHTHIYIYIYLRLSTIRVQLWSVIQLYNYGGLINKPFVQEQRDKEADRTTCWRLTLVSPNVISSSYSNSGARKYFVGLQGRLMNKKSFLWLARRSECAQITELWKITHSWSRRRHTLRAGRSHRWL